MLPQQKQPQLQTKHREVPHQYYRLINALIDHTDRNVLPQLRFHPALGSSLQLVRSCLLSRVAPTEAV